MPHRRLRHHAQDIRRHAAAELKSGAAGAGSADHSKLLAAQIGRSSIPYHAISGSSAMGLAPNLNPMPSPNMSVHSSSSHLYSLAEGSIAGGGGSVASVEPLDYEEYVYQQHRGGERDPLGHVFEFPGDDIEVKIHPKKIRTLGHVLPEDQPETLDSTVQNCIDAYTSDYVVIKRKNQHLSSSIRTRDESEERLKIAESVPAQEFEIDDSPDTSPEYEHLLRSHVDVSRTRKWRRSYNTNFQCSMPNSLGGSRNTSSLSLDTMPMPKSTSLTSLLQWSENSVYEDCQEDSICDKNDFFQDDWENVDLLDGDKTPTNDSRRSSKLDPVCLTSMLEAMSIPQVLKKVNKDRSANANEVTPRGSWATFDLRNSQPDALVPGLLDQVDALTVDQLNEMKRCEKRSNNLFIIYPAQNETDMVERRLQPEEPTENCGQKILVQCNKLELNIQVEPIFASMALYDAKEKKKISENFYFDLNPEQIKRMLEGYIPQADFSTQARACTFEISNPTPDIFLVVKLEKVLQGDISECAEPYLKESNIEKVRSNAHDACSRLGKYRMPFAWTAIWLQNIIKGKQHDNDSGGSDAESTASNSLDRKSSTSSFEQFRRSAATKVTAISSGENPSSLNRKTSIDRRDKRSSWAGSSGSGSWRDQPGSDDMRSQLESFPPVTLTVSSFFKQEGEKLKDEDLYKFLLDLKRPSTALKKLKCIRGTLKLDISVGPDQAKNCFTPELAKLIPFPDLKSRPTKEILEFPPRELLVPNYQFRNLLYVCPKDLNFTKGERARNIAIKVQFMGEDDFQGMKVIFGKSSCPEFSSEVYTAVTYHNKTPDFYEEIKIKLPSNLRERHHLLFTFYHISCQGQRKEQISTEQPVGYTWIPVFRNGSLQTGLFELPVMIDPPTPAMRYIATDSGGAPPGTKWIDNKKPIFTVELNAVSTVHPIDVYLDSFLNLTASLQLGPNNLNPGVKMNERTMEDDLIHRLQNLDKARLEPLIKFLPVLLDKLLLLMVKPPTVAGHTLNIAQFAFNAIAAVVNKISKAPELQHHNDRHGRNNLLISYIHYQAHLPHPDFRTSNVASKSTTQQSKVSLLADDEVGSIIMKGQHETDVQFASTVPTVGALSSGANLAKLVHEQLALQWSISSGQTKEAKDSALQSGWFFLELMIKAMIEHLATTSRLNITRKNRFSEQFHDDIINLVASLTSDIVCRHKNQQEMVEQLNASLAFFLQDLLSVMDRGYVFSLIRTYMKDVNSRMTSSSDSLPLWRLQLDFVRIVCSHEHFVSLNLPSVNPATDLAFLSGGASSPSPSIRSNDSQSSFIAHSLSGGQEKIHWAELTQEFRKRHFLVGMVLSLISKSFEQPNVDAHARAINAARNLIYFHDSDPRYQDRECKSRVATLYLPLVGIAIDNLQRLYSWPQEGEVRIVGSANPNEQFHLILTAISDNVTNTKGPILVKEETTRHLLICVLWVIKHVEKSILKLWWSEMSNSRLQVLLEILRICISCFQYKGKKAIRKNATLGARKSSDMKTRLEDMIIGQSSHRQELMARNRKDKMIPPSSPNPEHQRRWNKSSSFLRSALTSGTDLASLNDNTVKFVDPEIEAHLEGLLANETSMIVLDAMELIVKVSSQNDQSSNLLASVLRVLLHGLGTNQSTSFLQHLFAVQRSFVFKFPNLLFDEATEHCSDLCFSLLKHCSASVAAVRSQASASLYLLMRQNFEIGNNFARVKMQVTMSLSKLVGTISNFNEDYLRKSLKTILVYAEQDQELADTSFPEQVQDLVFNLHMILSDTVKMKEYIDDPEMHMDLMFRIAKGYQNSPDLRLTWLESMASKHEKQGHFAEAAMCKVHCAALISEYLHMLEDRKYMPTGAVTFSELTPNALEESAVSDDVVSPGEEGICTGKNFTETGLMSLLDEAAKYFSQAGMYETVNQVYKASLPIAEAGRNFKKLAEIHSDLFEAFKNINRLQGKRIFGTYFRVGFYGARFGDLDGEEYIYKEKALAKLPEIAHRLENFYGEKFGKDVLVIIKDSKMVEISKLNPEKAYIQITYVEPYFDNFELRDRLTAFEKNFNIIRFIFATPFTPDGNPHGELHEQYKRKTILTTSNHFPYIKTRIKVVDRKQVVLTPIEVAIEDVQKKIQELETATNQEPADPKILQMVLQGCIGTTVNQGPLEVANVFLKELFEGSTNGKIPSKHQNKLRLCFKDFDKKCDDALKRNKRLITSDQKEYQKELEKNYAIFHKHMSPLFSFNHHNNRCSLGLQDDLNESKVTSPMV